MKKVILSLEKKPNGLKNNYKRVFNMDVELYDMMDKAIKRLEEGQYQSCNQNNFIRRAIRAYAHRVLTAKEIGESFKD